MFSQSICVWHSLSTVGRKNPFTIPGERSVGFGAESFSCRLGGFSAECAWQCGSTVGSERAFCTKSHPLQDQYVASQMAQKIAGSAAKHIDF